MDTGYNQEEVLRQVDCQLARWASTNILKKETPTSIEHCMIVLIFVSLFRAILHASADCCLLSYVPRGLVF